MDDLDAYRCAKLVLDTRPDPDGHVRERLALDRSSHGSAPSRRAGRGAARAVTGTVIPFPPRLRVVPVEAPVPEVPAHLLVEHNGRTFRAADLMAHLSSIQLAEIANTVPRSWQSAWDEVVRRWPGLAEEIAADISDRGEG